MKVYVYFSTTFAEPVLTAYDSLAVVNDRFNCQLEQNTGKGYEVSETTSGKRASLDNGKDAARRWSVFGYRAHEAELMTDRDYPYICLQIDRKDYEIELRQLADGYEL